MNELEFAYKLVLLVLLTQMGKTFTTIDRIKKEIENDEEFGRSIHLVYTMNTLLSGKQFSKRLEILEKTYGKGSVIIFASKYNGPYVHVKKLIELQGLCMDITTRPRVVVMCSNDCRFDDGVKFIEVIEHNKTEIERVYVYFDELHAYINSKLRDQIERIHSFKIIQGIIALTATPKTIWKPNGFWSKIPMIDLDEFNEENYAGYKDMTFTNVDDFFLNPYTRPSPFNYEELNMQTINYIKYVLKKYPNILKDNARVFIPAHISRKSHNEVRNLVFEFNKNAIVILLNGKEKTLTYYENECEKKIHLISNDDEICKVIAEKIIENGFEGRPLVFTGFLCVGMGQTLTHELLGSFTSAIFGHMDLTNDQIYQLFGRITGRIKSWNVKYVKTNVYCPTLIMNRCIAMEECARNIANDYNGLMASEDDYMLSMNNGENSNDIVSNFRKEKEEKIKRTKRATPIQHNVAFNNLLEVNQFLKKIYGNDYTIRSFHKPKNSNFELSTRLNAWYKKKKDELTENDRLTEEIFNKIPYGQNISSKKGHGQQYMIYPVYKDMESSPSEVKYYVRYLDPKNIV